MPVSPPPRFALGAIKPLDAMEVFAARKLLRPSFRWQDVWNEEHARAFAVAGVLRLDVLETIRTAVEDAVTNGTDFGRFSKALTAELVKKGYWGDVEVTDPATGEVRITKFDQARLQLIYQVNLRQSHAAGRWARIMRSNDTHIVYKTMGDQFVRPQHRAWNNIVLPKDHPWWDTHFPPCGWRCRCTAYGTDERGVDRLRESAPKEDPVKTEPPPTRMVEFVNRVTGRTEQVPYGIDPGFAYNPGKVHLASATERLEVALAAVKPTLPGAGNVQATTSAVIARQRREPAFDDFLKAPPLTPRPAPARPAALPVAAVPGLAGEPTVASVPAQALREQARTAAAELPQTLPTDALRWVLAQAVIDQGQRLDLPDGRVLWWWPRSERIVVLELERGLLAWAVKALLTLTRDEAVSRYPGLEALL